MNDSLVQASPSLPKAKDFSSILSLPVLPLIPMIEKVDVALRVAEAFWEAELHQLEITFRSEVAPEALRCVVREFPDMTVGAGTLLSAEQVREAVDAGARFGVSPGANRRVLEAARKEGFPFLPGIATPSEVEMVLEEGFLWQKIPGVLGNLEANLDWYHAAYGHKGLRLVPAGGVSLEEFPHFLQHPVVGALAGIWATSPDLLKDEKWDVVKARASQLVALFGQKSSTGSEGKLPDLNAK
jgi:2-dehydro-3-deoxyphosphogluconate aldolase/(4S)-4-hydroxy-2-oxoglutarate aldolase